MTQPQAELRIRLVVDDGTSETLNKVKESLGGIHAKAEETGHAVEGIFSLEKLKVGFEVARGIFEAIMETAKSGYEIAEKFGEAATEAAGEAQKQERAMTGTMFMIDKGQHSMEALGEYTAGVREDLEKAGLAAGVAVGPMTEMFETIVERGRMSSESAKELTEQMATVGKVTHGGMQALASGFSMIELGVIRARNPVVQLIASTGLLHGNAKQIAQAMSKMTPEKQLAIASEAMKKQAESMQKGGGMALTQEEIKTSLSGYREMFFEAMGKPMLNVLLPALTEVSHWLAENSDALKEYAAWIGHGLGEFISGVKQAVLGIYEGIQANWAQVSATFHGLFDEWYQAWETATTRSGDIKTTFKEITTSLLDALQSIMKYTKAFFEVMMDAKDAWDKLSAINDNDPTRAKHTHIGDTQIRVQTAAVQALQDTGTTAEFEAASTKLARMAQDTYQGLIPDDEAFAKITQILDETRVAREQEDAAVAGLRSNVAASNVDAIGTQIRAAQAIQDSAYEVTAAKMFLGSASMAVALEQGAIKVDGGFDAFIKTVEERSPETAEALKKMLAGIHGKGITDIKGMGGANFNIGNITIHQDFRDQDPDRVIVAFRRDLMKHAVARTQSRTPFG